MKYKPHDYQKFAVDFIETHPEAAVLLECGLGKTSITLTALNDLMFDKFEVRKVLIIAPIRVCKNSWAAEIAKWDHLEGLNYSLVLGSREQRLAALRQKADLYIINRENVQWLIESSGMPFDFDMVVIDELSSFKNHQSKRFKALRKVRPFVKRIVGLTGTPCSNGLMDLWAQFRLLDKGERLGKRIGQYRDAYFTPDWNGFHYSSKCRCPVWKVDTACQRCGLYRWRQRDPDTFPQAGRTGRSDRSAKRQTCSDRILVQA